MNNKQSSVEWSIDQMIALCEDYDDGKINYTDYCNGVKEVKSQAKVMHKEEMIEFSQEVFRNRYNQVYQSLGNIADDKYKETFGGNNE